MKTYKNTLISKMITIALVIFASNGFAQTIQTTQAIRPFHVNIPETALTELRQRVQATRWPEKETVTNRTQGVNLDQIQPLVEYWGTNYDWRKAEAKLNALPQYITNIDGLDIHFLHIRSKNPNVLPLIVTHGWPGSVFELLKIIDQLTNPEAYVGKASDAFDVVIPSIPGYGFSEKPKTTGWWPDHIALAWDVLMKCLGYTHYVAQGGDWGSVVASAMARQKPVGLLGIHVNMPATVPADIAKMLRNGSAVPATLSVKEKAAFNSLNNLYRKRGGYTI